jgi:hypothetical protein
MLDKSHQIFSYLFCFVGVGGGGGGNGSNSHPGIHFQGRHTLCLKHTYVDFHTLSIKHIKKKSMQRTKFLALNYIGFMLTSTYTVKPVCKELFT